MSEIKYYKSDEEKSMLDYHQYTPKFWELQQQFIKNRCFESESDKSTFYTYKDYNRDYNKSNDKFERNPKYFNIPDSVKYTNFHSLIECISSFRKEGYNVIFLDTEPNLETRYVVLSKFKLLEWKYDLITRITNKDFILEPIEIYEDVVNKESEEENIKLNQRKNFIFLKQILEDIIEKFNNNKQLFDTTLIEKINIAYKYLKDDEQSINVAYHEIYKENYNKSIIGYNNYDLVYFVNKTIEENDVVYKQKKQKEQLEQKQKEQLEFKSTRIPQILEEINKKSFFSQYSLINEGLKLDPNNQELLQLKKKKNKKIKNTIIAYILICVLVGLIQKI